MLRPYFFLKSDPFLAHSLCRTSFYSTRNGDVHFWRFYLYTTIYTVITLISTVHFWGFYLYTTIYTVITLISTDLLEFPGGLAKLFRSETMQKHFVDANLKCLCVFTTISNLPEWTHHWIIEVSNSTSSQKNPPKSEKNETGWWFEPIWII